MPGWIQQTHRVVLAIDVDKSAAKLPQDSGGGRHPVDAAGALALGGDLTAEQQRFRALIACLFQTVKDGRRHILKCSPDDSLGRTGAHEILRGAVTQNSVDGVDEDGFACARLTGQDVEALFKMDIGFLASRSERATIRNVSSPERVPTTFFHFRASNTSQAAFAMPE